MGAGPGEALERRRVARATVRSVRAALPFEGRRENLAQAGKLSRTHAMLVEALNRHRGKGQQKIIVERVNVAAGGQAIVGNIKHEGEGLSKKVEINPAGHAERPL